MGDTSDPTRVAVSDPRPAGAFVLQHRPDHAGGPVLEAVDTPERRRRAFAAAAADEAAGHVVTPAADDPAGGQEEEV